MRVARQVNRLTARKVATLAEPGRHADGGGLYLVVDKAGSKRWTMLYDFAGKRREMGLGSAAVVSLASARESVREAREQLARGVDPIAARQPVQPASVETFGVVAHRLIRAMEPGWRGKNTASGWRRAIDTHAAAIKDTPVDQVDTAAVLRVLEPIWTEKPETAGKVRERIERVLDAAKVQGLRPRDSENPARWRGHLRLMLAPRQRLTRGHHPALPYADTPAFMARLREAPSISARALEWTVLTAAREAMTLGVKWGEISGDLWTVPANRMKGGEAFEAPLTAAALAVLDKVRVGTPKPDDLVFPSPLRPGEPMSDAAMDAVLDRLVDGYTVHGFRSTFRDWAGDNDWAEEVAEAALAHAMGSSVRRAYRRGVALSKRRELMEAWAAYLGSDPRTPAASPRE